MLTANQVKQATAKVRPYKLSDGGGLYLLIKSNGRKYWRMNFRYDRKQKTLSFGVYPRVSLQLARGRAKAARDRLDLGYDPSWEKQVAKLTPYGRDNFEGVAREWFRHWKSTWAKSHSDKVIQRLERDVFPWLGKRPIAEITAPEVLTVLRRIASRGAVDTAHRAKQNCGQIFRYAVASGRAESDPSAALKGALPPLKHQHYASLTDPAAIGELLRTIEHYHGALATRCALQLSALLFVRPGELRQAEWSEVDLEQAQWRIPAERMKAGVVHIVPLSRQAVNVLREIMPATGHGRYVFPGVQRRTRPMSENTVNLALRRMGYTNAEMTAHGFRSMASTRLNEQGWPPDVIERQLAHIEGNAVRAAYNYAQYLPERRRMMQAWADYLDELRCRSM